MNDFAKLNHYYPGDWSWSTVGDWDALDWFGEGDKPTREEFDALPEPPRTVPESVTRVQAKIALAEFRPDDALYLEAVAAITAAGIKAQLWWNDAERFYRNHPLIAAMQAALDLSDDDVDQLFINAENVA